ncbi:MAG TPA: hypothetical protein DEP28_12580 [Bacteroidetes bacterium]|nr:DUF559 domain-containing protein [Ignavibacteria bacterium]HCA44075.1 hypothetical protein [Bacteroidota bacterium]HCN36737.1 hypothetical protein [Bacteroidota bacterium]
MLNINEKILWLILKNYNNTETVFKRQFVIGKYVLDYYNERLKLGIELKIGGEKNNKYHSERKNFLNEKGIKLISVNENFLQSELNKITKKILNKRRSK